MSDLKNVKPLDDFNWDEFENGGSANVSKEDLEKAYDETLNKVTEHQVVEGTVISVDKKEVIVNIGYKSDGIIPASEFRYNPDLKVGDKVEVYVENQEDVKGQLVLSHKKARLSKSWERVNEALENEEVIQGYIKCRTKGGMIVDVFGIEAFLPGSQIDVHPIRDYDIFVGKTMEFKVVKINQEFRNVVVSHKALIEQELEQQRKEIIGKLEKGQPAGAPCSCWSTGTPPASPAGRERAGFFPHLLDPRWKTSYDGSGYGGGRAAGGPPGLQNRRGRRSRPGVFDSHPPPPRAQNRPFGTRFRRDGETS